ncbi:MAG: hypothetical protein FWD59_10925, partial [Micrococcales bacterium]|nr:hypothetical protein [Micrococcales bacterium]
QTSELGSLLDPAADRAFIIVGVVCLAWRGIIPWWLLAALLAREVVMGITLLARRRAGLGPMAVEFLGKAATLALMYAFPLLLIASLDWWIGDVAWVLGWACSLWGLGLYWVVCVVYVLESRDEIREAGVGEGVTACVTQATSERGAVT